MSSGVRPEKSANQKMLENVRYMRARPQEFSREDIDAEMERWQPEIAAESKAERKLSTAEKVAAVGSKMGSGITFGWLDEALGVGGQDETDVQRFLQRGLEEENPALAMGAEIVGGMAMPGSVFKVAKNASRLRKVGTAVKEGIVQGGLAGAGNANGSLEDRLYGAGVGAGVGGVVSGAISGGANLIGAARTAAAAKRGVHTPTLDELVERMPRENVDAARARLGEFKARGLEGEARMADILPDGEGTLRAQRTANKDVAKTIDADLRGRSTRLANIADDRLSQHTATDRASAKRTQMDRTAEAQAASKPAYDAAEGEWLAFEQLPANATKAIRKQLRDAVNLPYVKEHIAALKGGQMLEFKNSKPDEHFLLDQVYKDIGDRIRAIGDNPMASDADKMLRRDLVRQRGELGAAMVARAPSYRDALDAFAGPMAHLDAFKKGAKEAPSDVIPDEMAGLDPATVKDYKQGKTGTLRANTPNPDLGEFARFSDVLAPVASKEKAAVFKTTFGEDAYNEYLADVLEMAKMQRMKAGAGQSETVDKLIEQIQLGGNPDLVDVAMQFASGGASPRGMLSRVAGSVGLDGLLSSKANAKANADFLLAPAKTETLDEILRLGRVASEPRQPAMLKTGGRGRDWLPTTDLVKNAAARETGAVTGRRFRSAP